MKINIAIPIFFFLFYATIAHTQNDQLISFVKSIQDTPDTIQLNKLDSLIRLNRFNNHEATDYLLDESYEIAYRLEDRRYLAQVHNSKGIAHNIRSEIDSAMIYLQKGIDINKEAGFQKGVADLNSNLGLVLTAQGKFKSAIERFLESIRIYDELGIELETANTRFNMSAPWLELGQPDRAEKVLLECLEIYEKLDMTNAMMKTKWHMAAVKARQNKHLESLALDKEVLAHYVQNNDSYHEMILMEVVGIDLFNLEEYDSSMVYLNKALELGKKSQDIYTIASTSRQIGMIQSKFGRQDVAIQKIEQALSIFDSLGYKDDVLDSYKELYNAQNQAGYYKQALSSLLTVQQYEDSIASKKMQTDMIELETQYETEKKEAQIVLLEKEALLDSTRKKALWTGLGLTLVSAFMALFGIMQRNKKKQAIETAKREKAEKELEFKKKELLAKVIQLSKKSEFLRSLEQEVNELKTSVGSSITKSTSRIDRMITNDAIDEEEWDQFSKEFSSVHEGFIQKITQTFGTFSQSELRLISLLKMNLTSKEIANILRISDEGIKKARYRLRKKMKLETGNDLQGIILTL